MYMFKLKKYHGAEQRWETSCFYRFVSHNLDDGEVDDTSYAVTRRDYIQSLNTYFHFLDMFENSILFFHSYFEADTEICHGCTCKSPS